MSKENAQLTLALVTVVLVVVIAWLGARYYTRRRGSKSRFALGQPAAPQIVETLGALRDRLVALDREAAAFDRELAALGALAAADIGGCGPSAQRWESYRAAVKATAAPLRAAEKRLSVLAPTYGKALGFYQGMRDSDVALAGAAASFAAAGAALQVRGKGPVTEPLEPCEAAAARGGAALVRIGGHIRGVSAAVHNLGTALAME